MGDILSNEEKTERLQAVKSIDAEIKMLQHEAAKVSGIKPKAIYIKTLTAYRDTLTKRINELEGIRNEITSAIYKVSDSVLQSLLIKRYIEGKTWQCIADELFYSTEHIQMRLHKKALSEIELQE